MTLTEALRTYFINEDNHSGVENFCDAVNHCASCSEIREQFFNIINTPGKLKRYRAWLLDRPYGEETRP